MYKDYKELKQAEKKEFEFIKEIIIRPWDKRPIQEKIKELNDSMKIYHPIDKIKI